MISQSVSWSVGRSACQSVIQSVARRVDQPVRQLVSRSVGQPVSQSVSQSVGRSASQSVGQSVGGSACQSVGRSVGPSVGQSVSRSVGQLVIQSLIFLFIYLVFFSLLFSSVFVTKVTRLRASYVTFESVRVEWNPVPELFVLRYKILVQNTYFSHFVAWNVNSTLIEDLHSNTSYVIKVFPVHGLSVEGIHQDSSQSIIVTTKADRGKLIFNLTCNKQPKC